MLRSSKMSTASKRTWLLAMAVSAPNFSTGLTPSQCCAAVTWAGEQQFCLACVQLQSVGGHPVQRSSWSVNDAISLWRNGHGSAGTAVFHPHGHEETRRAWTSSASSCKLCMHSAAACQWSHLQVKCWCRPAGPTSATSAVWNIRIVSPHAWGPRWSAWQVPGMPRSQTPRHQPANVTTTQ